MAELTLAHGQARMVDYTPASDVSAGEVIVLEDAVRIAHLDISADRPGALAAGGAVYQGAKETGVGTGWNDGDTLYWDDTNNRLDDDSSSGTRKKVGLAVGDAGDDDETAFVQHVPN